MTDTRVCYSCKHFLTEHGAKDALHRYGPCQHPECTAKVNEDGTPAGCQGGFARSDDPPAPPAA